MPFALRDDFPQGQPVEKPKFGRPRPQTALRWFAGKVLRHKGYGLRPYNPGRRQCLLHLHFFDTLSLRDDFPQGIFYICFFFSKGLNTFLPVRHGFQASFCI